MMAGTAGKGVVSQTTGKPLIGRSFPTPPKPYYRRTHDPRRTTPCYASIISCTTVRRVCFPIPPFPVRSRWISSVRRIAPGTGSRRATRPRDSGHRQRLVQRLSDKIAPSFLLILNVAALKPSSYRSDVVFLFLKVTLQAVGSSSTAAR